MEPDQGWVFWGLSSLWAHCVLRLGNGVQIQNEVFGLSPDTYHTPHESGTVAGSLGPREGS